MIELIDSNGIQYGPGAIQIIAADGKTKWPSGGGPGTVMWGSITGTITLQTDLITYLSTNYFPIPTGTTAQYIRGDGTLATFPTTSGDSLSPFLLMGG